MKSYQLILTVVCMLQIFGCKTDKSRDFLGGTFINSSIGAFSTADDTLFIEQGEGNIFLIHRSTGFNLIDNGKLGKREHEKEEWKALYDEGTKSLSELAKGKLITIYPNSGYLLVGKRKYIKK